MSPADIQYWNDSNGETFLSALNSLIQIAKLHSDNNDLLLDSSERFLELVKKTGENQEAVLLQIQNGRFYLQGEKIRYQKSNANIIQRMFRFMENRAIFGIRFDPEFSGVNPKSMIAFARLLERCIRQENPMDWLKGQIERHNLSWVSIEESSGRQPVKEFSSESTETVQAEKSAENRKKVRKSYAHVLSAVKDVARKLSTDQNAGMRQSVRLVQNMVDILSEDESLFMAISTIRVYDDYTYVHSLNVSVLSMCLGKRIGLAHDALERLGLCGLFHDLGKVEIPKKIVNKKGNLDREEYDELKNHSMHSARLILKLKADRDRKIKLLAPPFEHHMGYDHSGYPDVGRGRKLSLFGRILTITDVYDAITSPRIYRPSVLSPDKALGEMLARSGTHFDPILLKVFIRMMGVYPVGTLLKLDTNEIGLVLQPEPDSDRIRPVVQLLVPKPDQKFGKGKIVDLMEKDSRTGRFLRNILESMHPLNMGIQPAEFLV